MSPGYSALPVSRSPCPTWYGIDGLVPIRAHPAVRYERADAVSARQSPNRRLKHQPATPDIIHVKRSGRAAWLLLVPLVIVVGGSIHHFTRKPDLAALDFRPAFTEMSSSCLQDSRCFTFQGTPTEAIRELATELNVNPSVVEVQCTRDEFICSSSIQGLSVEARMQDLPINKGGRTVEILVTDNAGSHNGVVWGGKPR